MRKWKNNLQLIISSNCLLLQWLTLGDKLFMSEVKNLQMFSNYQLCMFFLMSVVNTSIDFKHTCIKYWRFWYLGMLLLFDLWSSSSLGYMYVVVFIIVYTQDWWLQSLIHLLTITSVELDAFHYSFFFSWRLTKSQTKPKHHRKPSNSTTWNYWL